MKCKNTRYDHECHSIYAAKYDGYCLNCANAGVPDLDGQIADLRAQVFGHCGTAASDALTPEATSELRAWAERFDDEYARDALAEIDRLRAALAARDRQLAELREACQPFVEYAQNPRHYDLPDDAGISGAWLQGDDFIRGPLLGDCRRLAALLPPTAKEEQP